MKENEKSKKSNKKWLIAIILIAVIVIALILYSGIFSIPTGLITGTETDTNPTTNEQPKMTVTGTDIIAKETTGNLPYYESVDLVPGGYAIQIITNKPVWVMIYDESHFNQWKNGYYGTTIIGTGSGREEYKTTNFLDRFYISKGGEGKYYIVLDGKGESSINLKLVQMFKY